MYYVKIVLIHPRKLPVSTCHHPSFIIRIILIKIKSIDNLFIGITPDYKIQVRRDILYEEDGPMLQHGLKRLHERKIILPFQQKDWPNKDHLDWRYREFLKVS